MHISWLGSTAIKLQVKPFDEDIIIVIDPYRPEEGTFPRSLSPHVGLFTRGQKDAVTLSGEPFILDTPGECDVKGVLVTAVAGSEPGDTMVRIDAENLSVAHLGMAKKALTEKQRELLSDVDILFVPVGGEGCYDAEAAMKAVNELEPRIVIPIAFQSDNNPKAQPIATFLKEMGVTNQDKPETKAIVKKKDLPSEETQVIVLAKE